MSTLVHALLDHEEMPKRHLVLGLLGLAAALLVHQGRAQAPPTETLIFPAVGDTYVDAALPTTNFNADGHLRADADPVRISYLRFTVAGLNRRPVVQARVQLQANSTLADSGGTIHRITDDAWDEATLTYDARPAVDGPALSTLGPVATGDIVEFDLGTAITADGTYSFAIDSASPDGVSYKSAASLVGQKPILLVTVAAGPAPSVRILQPPEGASFFVGDPITLQGTATDMAGDDLSGSLAWRSDLQGDLGGGATVSTTLARGDHTITAAVTDGLGLTGEARLHVSVTPQPAADTPPLVAITAPLAGRAYTAGVPIQFVGTANDLEDGDLTASLAWTSDRDGTLGTGGSFTRPLSAGMHRITASATDGGTLTSSAEVMITVEAPTTLQVVPTADAYVDSASASANFGASSILSVNSARTTYLRFTVNGIGTRQVVRAALRLQVDGSSAAASPAGGTVHTISNGTWGERTITAKSRPLVDGPAFGSVGAVKPGQVVEFDLTGAVTGDGTYDLALVSPSADNANYRSRETLTPPKLVLALSGNAPIVAITAPPNQAVFPLGAAVAFTGVATDVEDGDVSPGLQWTSSLDGDLGTGARLSSSSLRVGTHTITAAATDSNGHPGQARIAVRVRGPNAAPAVTITAPADGASAPAGTPVILAATATDDFDPDPSASIRWSSSLDGDLGAGGARTVVLRHEGVHVLTAAVTDSDGATGTASVTFTVNPTPPVVTIVAPAEGTRVFQGTPLPFTGTAIDATDGVLSNTLHWTSSLDGDLGAGASITAGTLGIGTHVITARVEDAGGLAGEATRTVVIRPPNVPPAVTIQAPADGAALLAGRPIVLAATAADAEDGDLGARVRWTSSLAGTLGTGGTLTVPALAPGAQTLTATVTDRDGAVAGASVHVSVSPSVLAFVPVADTYVDAATPTKVYGTAPGLLAGSSPVRQAFLRFQVAGVGPFAVQRAILRLTAGKGSSDGGRVGGAVYALASPAAWSEAKTTYNTRPAVVGTPLATRLTAIKPGQVVDLDVTSALGSDGVYDFALLNTNRDWVRYQSREGAKKPELLLTLEPDTAPTVIVTAPAPAAVSSPGAPVTFAGAASDAESGDLSGRIQWASDRDGALGSGPTITVATLSPGPHTISARVTDPSGLTAEAETTVVVDHPPAVTIDTPADGAVVFTDAGPITFTATAVDAEDGDLAGALGWTSSLDGPLGTGGSVSRALTVGLHTVSAAVTDTRGVTSQARIGLRVRAPNAPPVVTIAAPADGAAVPAGPPVSLAATATDDFDGDLSSRIEWSSDVAGPLGTGATRTLTLHEGTHRLTATVTDSDGAPASATITLTITPTPPVVTIDAPVPGALVFANLGAAFGASAIDATDGDLSDRLVWTSDIDGPLGSGASFFANTLSVGTHRVTATVADAGGLTGGAERIVVVLPPNTYPAIAIDAPTDGAALFAGLPLLLAAHAIDEEDGELSGAIRWSSDRDGPLGTGAMLTMANLSAGAHTMTASVTDAAGATSAASVSVVVGARTIALAPVADTYVDASNPGVKFGSATSLFVDNSPVKQAYLRFDVRGIMPPFTVQRARLRLTAASSSAAASASGGRVQTIVAGNLAWSEASTTWATRPALDGPTLAARGAVTANQVVDFDVTAAVPSDGIYSFGLATTSSDEVVYRSREATTGRPELLLELHGPDDPVVTIAEPGNGAQVSSGQEVVFSAAAVDRQDGDLSPRIQWTSSLDGPLGTGASFARVLSPGTHTIAATVTDSSNVPGSATVVVTVTSNGNLGFRDFTYPAAVGTGMSNEATAQKPESHLWFVDGTWWATLYSGAAHAHHIHRLDRSTQRWIDTGVFIDERPMSRQDCLWNGEKLYMVSRTGYLAPGTNRLLRYSYDPTLGTYVLDAGFPVELPGGGTNSMTLAEDSTGRFWVAYTRNGSVFVAHSLDDDLHWSAPFVLPATQGLPVATTTTELAGVIAMNGKIGVFWTNQRTQADYFAVHPDDAAPGAGWTTEVAVAGSKAADDHFNMKLAADGRLWVVMKTSRSSASDTLVGLLVRSPDGTWSPMYTVATFATLGTRGLVQLDELHRRVYIFYSPFHQSIYYKTTDMDRIALQGGLGIPVITSTAVRDINNPTGTKQPVTPESGIVVVASSPGDLSYWHNRLPISP